MQAGIALKWQVRLRSPEGEDVLEKDDVSRTLKIQSWESPGEQSWKAEQLEGPRKKKNRKGRKRKEDG